jgi:hypothetical protein
MPFHKLNPVDRCNMLRTLLYSIRNSVYLLTMIVVVSAPFLILASLHPATYQQLINEVKSNAWVLRLIRWILISIFVYLWPYLLKTVATRKGAIAEVRFSGERIRIALWLILFELLICENWIVYLITKLWL